MTVTSPDPAAARLTLGWPTGPLGAALAEVVTAINAAAAAAAVLDCGGGSGSLAVPIAARGPHVTVVDASIDALATLQRRAIEAGVAARVRGVQADIENLADVIPGESMDLVLLHGVVNSTELGGPVIAAAAAAVRPGGYISVVAANPAATVIARALSGDLAAALADLESPRPAIDVHWLCAAVTAAGCEPVLTQGLGAFSSTVPGTVVSPAHRATDALAELDRLAATRSPYRDIAGSLHVLARRPDTPRSPSAPPPAGGEELPR